MPILVIILNHYNNCLNRHLVELHSMIGTLSMPESMAKDIECLETPMKCLLTIFSTCQKLFKVGRMLIFCGDNFAWLARVATVSHGFISFLKPEIKSILIPFFFILIRVTTTENSDIMTWGFMRAADPNTFWFIDWETKFQFLWIQLWSNEQDNVRFSQYNNFDHEELTMPAQFPLGLYHSEEGSSRNSFVLKMTPSTVSLWVKSLCLNLYWIFFFTKLAISFPW